KYRAELQEEWQNILAWWMKYAVDETHGGFYGKINNHNQVHQQAEKGIVLNSRILWTFSSAHRQFPKEEYLALATRAYQYITTHFHDKKNGGLYWSVDYAGQPLNRRKQVYGLAFAIYGMSEYYQATRREEALDLSLTLFHLIEQYSFDNLKNGYIEALSPDWLPIADLRLSDKDANEKKTMNTHLHIMEAYTNLYRCYPDEKLAEKIKNLIHIFLDHIINRETAHLDLFFDEDWQTKGNIISFGHDIEASWLLLEAAEITGDEKLTATVVPAAVKLANAAAEGLEGDGGLDNEIVNGIPDREKHWWQQAEAIVGFLNIAGLTGEKKYLLHSLSAWRFIRQYILDKQNGEWFWGVSADHTILPLEDKAGFWKCPYHNSRACLEGIKRIDRLLATYI
ncbi:MAG TPA: AGE family epimerase/isomerase, partial [Chitinophagaceae bacterium]